MRYPLIDFLKGFAILNVIAFHFLYDIYVMTGANPDWPFGLWVSLWQETGLSLLMVLGGMSARLMGQAKRWRNGVKLVALGLAISLGTYLLMPSELILYGVLNFFGCALLLTAALERRGLLSEVSPASGLAACAFGYLLTYRIQQFYAATDALAILGLRSREFYSADYVPLLPYVFVFWTGFFALQLLKKYTPGLLQLGAWKPMRFLGKHSLGIYLAHQPLLVGVLKMLNVL